MKSLSEYERENAEAVKRFQAAKRKQAREIVKAYIADLIGGGCIFATVGPEERRLMATIERALRGEV